MAQDVISDALNMIMNAKRRESKEVVIRRKSKFLLELFGMMKERGHIDFKEEDGAVKVNILKLHECKAIKPRYYVKVDGIQKYLRRFLPSRNFGTVVISTSSGLIDHDKAYEKKIGGSLIAYFY
jgi:ribosomal protein S8